ncbi:MAG: UDP-N-acetylglucosamine 2-epimerase (non-hydrolyzing) [Ginsengibacter sp.]
MKIVIIVGARPQFIKLAALMEAVNHFPPITIKIIHTGQHYDLNMSGNFFLELKIKTPDYNCNINETDRSLAIEKMIGAIEQILIDEKPEWVIVIGDTNSTLSGALAAIKLNIKVAHIEAGLRSFNNEMPEEINRRKVDKMADILFPPTSTAEINLMNKRENLKSRNIKLVGDLMLDNFNCFTTSEFQEKAEYINFSSPFIIATLHREYILSNRAALANVIQALNEINESVPVIFSAHPRTFKVLSNMGTMSTFRIIPPQSYLSTIAMVKNCMMVITDSGGLQREAYFARKGSLCIRTETEWQELEKAGVTKVTGYDTTNIIEAFKDMSSKTLNFDQHFFGTGNAGRQIFESIISFQG